MALLVRGLVRERMGRGRKKGRELLKRAATNFFAILKGLANSAPLVGHIIGAIRYACGDRLGGHNAMKSSSRTTAGMLGAVVGWVFAPGPGAIGGYLAGVNVADGVISGKSLQHILLVKQFCRRADAKVQQFRIRTK